MEFFDSVPDLEWICILTISVSYDFRVSREAAKSRSREGLSHHPLASGIPLLCFAASRLRVSSHGIS
jgi:hypothetical protein